MNAMRRGLVVVAVVLAALVPAAALADGDPASDVLPTQNVFTPYPTPPGAQALAASVLKVFESGHRVKVAVIASRRDLGSIPSLFGKANAYARFLGIEIGSFYSGPLLIVMPSGFGIFDQHHSTSAEAAVLGKLKVDGSSPASLVASAAAAVDRLAAAGTLNSPDTLRPNSYPLEPTVHPGKQAVLTYHVLEDSGRSSEVVTVYAGAKVLAVLHSPMQLADYNVAHSVRWNVPADVPRKGLRFCIVATDPSGNRQQQPACSPIAITSRTGRTYAAAHSRRSRSRSRCDAAAESHARRHASARHLPMRRSRRGSLRAGARTAFAPTP
jgi:hypothetical protein